jgi:CheY-like chemotaxis protein
LVEESFDGAKVVTPTFCKENPMSAENEVVLLAEDDENDIELLKRAFKQTHVENPLQIVRDGEEAIEYLKGEGKFSERQKYPLPTLVLLDLKMPRKDGFEVLRWIREQPSLKALRVLVLTTSSDIRDVTKAYKLGANSFLVKTLDIQDFGALVSQIKNCWLTMSRAPTVERPPGASGSGNEQ